MKALVKNVAGQAIAKRQSHQARKAAWQRQARLMSTPVGRSQIAWEQGQTIFTDSIPLAIADVTLQQLLSITMPPEPRFPSGSRWVIKFVTQQQSVMKTRSGNFNNGGFFGASYGSARPTSIVNVYTFEREGI